MFSFLTKLIKPIGGFLGKIFGGKTAQAIGTAAGTGAASTIGGGVGQYAVNKVAGIPTPENQSGAEAGQFANDYYSKAFPGTSPWDQLGSSNPGGQIIGEAMQNDMQQKIHMQNLIKDLYQGERHNQLMAQGMGSPMGVQAAKDQMELYKTGGVTSGQDLQKEKTEADITATKYKNPLTMFGNFAGKDMFGTLGKMMGPHTNGINKTKQQSNFLAQLLMKEADTNKKQKQKNQIKVNNFE